MKRLTNKDLKEKYGFYPLWCGNTGWVANEGTDKLGKLEDIEEELGIDLTIYFGALKDGVYYYSNSQLTKDFVYPISNFLTDYNDKLSYSFMTKFEHRLLSFDDYGKTWALTKEELI